MGPHKRERSASSASDDGSSNPSKSIRPETGERPGGGASEGSGLLGTGAAALSASLAALQSSVAAQLAAASQKLAAKHHVAPTSADPAAAVIPSKKAAQFTLRLDAQGREIDEQGNLVTQTVKPVRTVAANQRKEKSKDEQQRKTQEPASAPPPAFNPYLAHLYDAGAKSGSKASGGVPSHSAGAADSNDADAYQDLRIRVSSREARGRKALNFVQPGTYIAAQAREREKAEERLRSGAASGRWNPQKAHESPLATGGGGAGQAETGAAVDLPAPSDNGVVPPIEWWDVEFLPKAHKAALGLSAHAVATIGSRSVSGLDLSLLALQHSKTHRFVQHPPSAQALKPEAPAAPLPMYLTEKERKRIRRQRRMAEEQEKRDKMMMGLIPVPEPKFKLSNFMRILGDQAIADPSKVEQKVIEQVRARELKHEMDNLARKLTPAQRREKKIRKLQEAASRAREAHVAVFCVSDLNDPRLRFKIDMNAQQWLLTGTVILCREGNVNLVYVEGGPRAVRKFTRLMMVRAKWGRVPTTGELAKLKEQMQKRHEDRYNNSASSEADTGSGASGTLGLAEAQHSSTSTVGKLSANSQGGEEEGHEGDMLDVESGDDDDDGDADLDDADAEGALAFVAGPPNTCSQLWSGVTAKRTFQTFRFQEARTQACARRILEAVQLHAYWDMAASSPLQSLLQSR
jgi:U4/U6 small nuclear ribonucleoprotein PRP3